MKFSDIVFGGRSKVQKNLQLRNIRSSYLSRKKYKNFICVNRIDWVVDLLNYRYALAFDPKEEAVFFKRYAYELDTSWLTWECYDDVGNFLQDPRSK